MDLNVSVMHTVIDGLGIGVDIVQSYSNAILCNYIERGKYIKCS